MGWILEARINCVIGRVHDGVEEVDPYTHIPIRLPECDANARLIAAAPDLLAALEYLVAFHTPGDMPAEFQGGQLGQRLAQARAAIKKARGE